MRPPLVSIVILNWNGKEYLAKCLSALRKITYKSIEIIVVDNGSKDGSQEYIRKYFHEVILIQNKSNYGFALGNNIGYKRAKGTYILFLNNDTIVTRFFLEPLVASLEKDSKIACVEPQMRILGDKNKLDEIGAYLTPTGFLYHFGFHKIHSLPLYNKPRIIFSAKGACMLMRKSSLDKTGGFDEDFFIFFEETDLCFRLWLYGYKIVYIPTSRIFHTVGGDTTKSDIYSRTRRIYLTFQNMNCSYLKNFGLYNLLTLYPVFIFMQIALIIYFVIFQQPYLSKAILSAWWWNIKQIRKTLNKRKIIQSNRTQGDTTLNNYILYKPKISYYYWLLMDARQYVDVDMPY